MVSKKRKKISVFFFFFINDFFKTHEIYQNLSTAKASSREMQKFCGQAWTSKVSSSESFFFLKVHKSKKRKTSNDLENIVRFGISPTHAERYITLLFLIFSSLRKKMWAWIVIFYEINSYQKNIVYQIRLPNHSIKIAM